MPGYHMTWRPDTPPGWYPDPSGAPTNRWWDGYRWTPYMQPSPKRGSPSDGTLIAIGGVVALLGCFLPWVSVVLLGSANLTGLLSNGTRGEAIEAALILFAPLCLVLSGIIYHVNRIRWVAVAALVIAACAGGFAGWWGIILDADLRGAHGFASLGVGPFVTLGGFVLAVIFAAKAATFGPVLAAPSHRSVAPGWYPSPSRPGAEQWWDGSTWTGHERLRSGG